MKSRRHGLERGWIVVSIIYGGVRAAMVWKFLQKYGVNPYVFGAIEVISAAFFGISSARVVGAVVDRTWIGLRLWLPCAVMSYFAPDIYVFLSVGRLPSDILAVLISVVCVSLLVTCIATVMQIRRGRQNTAI